MQLLVVVMMAGFVDAVSSSVSVTLLNADGAPVSPTGTFNEGDTAIIRCRGNYGDTPFDSAQFEWNMYSQAPLLITDGDRIVADQPAVRDRFSGANLTDIGSNTLDYRVTVNGVDRYDNGYHFYCRLSGESSSSGIVAAKMTVNWDPPSAKCVDIDAKAKQGDEVSYHCSAVDVDARSNGSLSLWKNDDKLVTEPINSPATPVGTEYSVSFNSQLTKDSANDVYTCRYTAIGGYEEYNATCTFNVPSCIKGPCPTIEQGTLPYGPTNGGEPSRGHVRILTVGVPMLMMYWIA